jgi:hypothetical protein
MAPVTIRGLAVAGGVAAVALLLPPPAAGQGLLAEGETGDDSPNAIGDEPKAAEPASAGCIRNPIPNSRFIYGWVRLGMSIFVY